MASKRITVPTMTADSAPSPRESTFLAAIISRAGAVCGLAGARTILQPLHPDLGQSTSCRHCFSYLTPTGIANGI